MATPPIFSIPGSPGLFSDFVLQEAPSAIPQENIPQPKGSSRNSQQQALADVQSQKKLCAHQLESNKEALDNLLSLIDKHQEADTTLLENLLQKVRDRLSPLKDQAATPTVYQCLKPSSTNPSSQPIESPYFARKNELSHKAVSAKIDDCQETISRIESKIAKQNKDRERRLAELQTKVDQLRSGIIWWEDMIKQLEQKESRLIAELIEF